MLVMCEVDGLTQGEKVFRRGMVFVLDESMAKDAQNLDDGKLEAKQKRLYGKRIYRRPFPDELIFAFKTKQIKIEDMEKEEKKIVIDFIKNDGEKKLAMSQALEDAIAIDEPSTTKNEI